MKNVIAEMLAECRGGPTRKVGYVGVEDDDYKCMVTDLCDDEGGQTDNNDGYVFNRVGLLEDPVIKGLYAFETAGPQPAPITRCKNDYFRFYKF